MQDTCLVFDCMETLVDMTEIPEPRDYALWTYEGSGVELLWESFDAFWEAYSNIKQNHHDQHGPHIEQDLMVRLTTLVEASIRQGRETPESLHGMTSDIVAAKLFDNFWSNYLQRCFVRDDVREVLELFKSHHYSMGVVSNFTVRGGVEEILERCGIDSYFQFVITSVQNAYRKPHPNLFYDVLRNCGCGAENVFYLGDDYECDYVGACGFGFKSFLLDRQNRYPEVENRVVSFVEFADLIVKSNR